MAATADNFDEQGYVKANPDVAEAVGRGDVLSGAEHFFSVGHTESRSQVDLGKHPSARHDLGVREVWMKVLPYVFLSLLASLVVAMHVQSYSVIGPVDELQQIDYADHLSRGELPIFPAPIGQTPLKEEACRGIDAGGYQFTPPPCGVVPYDSSKYQEGGLSTQAFHPPLYYAVVGPTSRVIANIFSFDSLVGIQRMLGAAWLAAGLCLALAASVRIGLSRRRATLVLALVAVMPQVVYAHSTVNNDVSALFVGALALWAVIRDTGSRWFSVLLVFVGAVAGLTKVTNGLGLGVAALLVFFAPWLAARRPRKFSVWTRFRPGVALLAGYLVANLVWQGIFARIRLASPRDVSIFNRFEPQQVTPASVIQHMSTYSDPFFAGQRPTPLSFAAYVAPPFTKPLLMTIAFLASLIFLAAVYGSIAIYGRRKSVVTTLGACTAATLLLAGPLQFYGVYLATSAGYSNTRYSWSVLPAYAVVTALAVKGKRLWVIAALFVALLGTYVGLALPVMH